MIKLLTTFIQLIEKLKYLYNPHYYNILLKNVNGCPKDAI